MTNPANPYTDQAGRRCIAWDRPMLARLKRWITKAKRQGKDEFTFDPLDGGGTVQFVTRYAEYLAEYLDSIFSGDTA